MRQPEGGHALFIQLLLGGRHPWRCTVGPVGTQENTEGRQSLSQTGNARKAQTKLRGPYVQEIMVIVITKNFTTYAQ